MEKRTEDLGECIFQNGSKTERNSGLRYNYFVSLNARFVDHKNQQTFSIFRAAHCNFFPIIESNSEPLASDAFWLVQIIMIGQWRWLPNRSATLAGCVDRCRTLQSKNKKTLFLSLSLSPRGKQCTRSRPTIRRSRMHIAVVQCDSYKINF